MSLSAKMKYIVFSTLTIALMSVLTVVLVVTLAVPPLEDGGSPEGPSRPSYYKYSEKIDDQSNKNGAFQPLDLIRNIVHDNEDVDDSSNPKSEFSDKHQKKPDVSSTYAHDPENSVKIKDLLHSFINLPRHHLKGETAEQKQAELKDLSKPEESDLVVRGESGTKQQTFGQFRYAAVAADADPCNTIGTNLLAKRGGSAVDAAIAVMLCVGVVNCHNSGIGGGHFMTIYDVPNDGRSTEKVMNTILARERAPLNASRDMFINTTDSSTKGGMAIAVPGEIKGFYRAWQKFGRVEWEELFQPTIDLCINGHLVNDPLAGAIRAYEDDIRADPNLSELFVKPDGSLVEEGDILLRPKMAATLQTIANDPEAFYNPESQLAQDIVADIADYGGIISLDDLQLYEVYDKDPLDIHLDNGDFTVYGPRPPSSGAIFQYILNILDGYNFTSDDLTESEQKILTYHRITEAFKFAYAKRSELGDEDFVDDIQEVIKNLTSAEYADAIRARINDSHTQDVWYYEPAFDIPTDFGTSHGNVFAADGSAVAITSTINLFFGSNVRGNRTGIFFNDEMDDFSTPGTSNDFGVPASPANYIEPYKMPMSSMCPSIITNSDGEVIFLSGAAGGTRITTATAYVTLHSLWFDMRVDEASNHARIHHQLVPNELRRERDFDEDVLDGLIEKGHEIDSNQGGIASVQCIHNTCAQGSDEELCIHAACDVRKSGTPDGY